VVLLNPVDEGQEMVNLTDTMGLSLSLALPSHSLELSGPATPAVYSAALRTLTYHHLSASPGNPSTLSRYFEFTVEDDHNATSETANLTLNIIPVNDAPLLSFLSGSVAERFSYTEDDPEVNIGQNLTLVDIDSSIQSVSLSLTNLLDGDQESVGYDSALLAAASVGVNSTGNGTVREIVFSGEASSSSYTEVSGGQESVGIEYVACNLM
jgi:hypothetical protein